MEKSRLGKSLEFLLKNKETAPPEQDTSVVDVVENPASATPAQPQSLMTRSGERMSCPRSRFKN